MAHYMLTPQQLTALARVRATGKEVVVPPATQVIDGNLGTPSDPTLLQVKPGCAAWFNASGSGPANADDWMAGWLAEACRNYASLQLEQHYGKRVEPPTP